AIMRLNISSGCAMNDQCQEFSAHSREACSTRSASAICPEARLYGRDPDGPAPIEDIRTIGVNPPGFKAREQAVLGRQWARRGLRERVAGSGNQLRPQTRRCRGHELSAIDRHGITSD